MTLALTREVPESISACELTHLERTPIDVPQARAEHAAYEQALLALGIEVRRLPPLPDHPDSVFVEDTAVVLDEVAILTRPGAASRRPEVASVREGLAPWRTLRSIEAPATLDGGDVLVLDREILVGLTARSNATGAEALARHVEPFGYRVRTVRVQGCLHLKSGVTRAGERTLVLNPTWVDPRDFPGWDLVRVDPEEPFGANVLWVAGTVICAEHQPRTAGRLDAAGCRLRLVPAGELALAEGGVTCCSLVVP